ncbi:MAG: hypothetical protein PHD43_22380 [Methylococcales bacterium]|nr:hypothetical protein [Methylococcales bacterium]
MSLPEPIAQLPASKKLQPGQAFISCRLASMRKIDTKSGPVFLTVAKMPAVDQFSHPQTIELHSLNRIGKSNDDWSGVVMVGGTSNTYKSVDKDTGESETVYSARNSLTVVED